LIDIKSPRRKQSRGWRHCVYISEIG